MTFIAIGVFGWGKGNTARDALKNMRAQVESKNRNKYVLYSCTDPDAYVTQMGFIHAKAEPVEIERKGVAFAE